MSSVTHIPDRIASDQLHFVASGRDRAVYRVEGHPWIIAKIMTDGSARLQKVLDHEAQFWRKPRPDTVPVTRVLGHCATDLGPAQLSEAVLDATGEIAPNLYEELCADSFGPAHLEALNTLVQEAVDQHIPFSDYSLRNLVFGRRSGDAAPRIYVVDGFGDKSLIQIKRWFRWANTPHILRKFGRVPRDCGLTWDRRTRRYSFAAGRTGARANA